MIFSLIKFGSFIVLCFLGIGQIFIYLKLKKHWESFPVVAATITKSRLFDLTGFGGFRTYEALSIALAIKTTKRIHPL
jgi:hypothetical protein